MAADYRAEAAAAAAAAQSAFVAVRTRYFDDAILAAVMGSGGMGAGGAGESKDDNEHGHSHGGSSSDGIRQIVLLAAGSDARSYRLPLPEEVTVFEVDSAAVIDYRARVFAGVVRKLVSTSSPAQLHVFRFGSARAVCCAGCVVIVFSLCRAPRRG